MVLIRQPPKSVHHLVLGLAHESVLDEAPRIRRHDTQSIAYDASETTWISLRSSSYMTTIRVQKKSNRPMLWKRGDLVKIAISESKEDKIRLAIHINGRQVALPLVPNDFEESHFFPFCVIGRGSAVEMVAGRGEPWPRPPV